MGCHDNVNYYSIYYQKMEEEICGFLKCGFDIFLSKGVDENGFL